MTDTIKVYRTTTNREYRWTRRAPNGEIIAASSEGYVDKDDALANIDRTQGGDYTVEEGY